MSRPNPWGGPIDRGIALLLALFLFVWLMVTIAEALP